MSGKAVGPLLARLATWALIALLFCPAAALADSQPGERVVVQLRWLHQFQFAGYYAALEKGYYQEAGLDVVLEEGGPGKNPIEEVVSGRAQYGAASSELLLARLRGKPVKALAVIFQQSPSVFLARKISGITTPKDMLGQRVMMMPGMDDAELLAMFLKEGVKLEHVHRLPTSFNVDDLINGKTDVFNAYLTNEPFYMEQKGMPAAIIRPSTYGIDFYGDAVFTSEEEVQGHPDRVRAFLQATLRGWQYAMDNPEEIIELILAKYSDKRNRWHLRYEAATMRELLQPDMIQLGHMNPGRWRHMADTFASLGMVAKDYKLDGFIHDPYAERDLRPLLWVGGVAGVVLLVVGVVAGGLARFNMRLKREVAERARAEERFATMAANVPGAIFQMLAREDGRRRYVYLSPRAKEFFGLEPEEVIAQGRLLNWHPEDAERIGRQAAASFASRSGHNVVGRILLPDGEEKWANLTASPGSQVGEETLYDGFILDVTERKLAEMEYLASERKIKAMSQAVEDALIMTDSQGKVLFWNPAAEKLFGYAAHEALGMDFHAMAASEKYRELARKGMEEFARSGRGPVLGTTTEIEATDRHGRVFPAEVTLSAFQVDDEWFAVGTVRDISERKRAEQALARNQEMLQRILDTSPVGVAISTEGVVHFANPRMAELINLRVGDSSPQAYVNIADRENLVRMLGEQEVVRDYAMQMYGPNGEIRDILATYLRTEYDGKTGILGWLVDITEVKKTEQSLKDSQRRLGDIIDFLPDPLMVVDDQGRVVSWNRAMERLTGVKQEDTLGKGDYEYALPFYGERRPALVDLAINWSDELAKEYMSIKRDGECLLSQSFHPHMGQGGLFLAGTAIALRDAQGRITGAIETLRDITERKRAEALMVEKEVAEEAAARAETARQEAEAARQEALTAQEELRANMKEIERFNRLALGREERVIELKRQANTLAALAGFNKPYADYDEEVLAAEEVQAPEEEEAARLDAKALAEILAVDHFRKLLDDFCQSVGIAAAIIDVQGNVLAASRWQRACTDFHRQSEVTCARCIESDIELAAELGEGKQYAFYRCKNGLTDAASPIFIDGRHLANTFVGQFFTAPPDLDFFRRQAQESGFDPREYLAAIAEVPVIDESRLPSILGFLVGMSSTVTESYSERLRAQRAEESMARRAQETMRERAAALSLAEDAEEARAEIEQYKGRLEVLVAERTEELKLSEERSRLLLHSAGEGIFGVDDQGRLTFINPAALSMLGFAQEEIMGRAVHDLIHHTRPDGQVYPQEQCPMHASFTEGATHNVDGEVLWRKDGTPFPVEYSSTPIAKDGRVMGAVITFRDISERRQAEEEMRQYLQDLERFNRLTLGREERMIELKTEINELLEKTGQGRKYRIVDENEPQRTCREG